MCLGKIMVTEGTNAKDNCLNMYSNMSVKGFGRLEDVDNGYPEVLSALLDLPPLMYGHIKLSA